MASYCLQSIFIISAILVYFLLSHNIICLNLYLDYYLHNFCQNEANYLWGLHDICGLLCNGSHNLNVNCHAQHLNKPIIFTGETLNNSLNLKFVIESIVELEDDEESWIYVNDNGTELLPDDEVWNVYLQKHVELSLGRPDEAGVDQLKKLLPHVKSGNLEYYKRFLRFINDHEFFMATVFSESRIFPKILGTCQSLYAVEFANVELPSSIVPFNPIKLVFNDKLEIAIDLIEYITNLNTVWLEVLHLCDIKYDHFGRSSTGEILFLDLDSIETDSSLNNIMLNTRNCSSDFDCEYFDCKSKCLFDGHCTNRTNNNLQVLCNKILLGNSSSYFGHYGLFNLENISSQLLSNLHKCKNSNNFDPNELTILIRAELRSNQFPKTSDL